MLGQAERQARIRRYDLIHAIANGITGDQAKDVYKDLPESTFKRWDMGEEFEE
jgi:hypothetical protein